MTGGAVVHEALAESIQLLHQQRAPFILKEIVCIRRYTCRLPLALAHVLAPVSWRLDLDIGNFQFREVGRPRLAVWAQAWAPKSEPGPGAGPRLNFD